MKHGITRLFVSVLGASAIVVAAAAAQKEEVTLSGCLVESQSQSGLFLVTNAIVKGGMGKPQAYKIVSAMEDPDFVSRRGHRVEVTGTAEQKTMPTGKVEDKDLPAFTVKQLVDVAPSCTTH